MPTYDAHATPFDLHGRMWIVPMDFSKGRLTVRYLGDTNDQGFDTILKAAEWKAGRWREWDGLIEPRLAGALYSTRSGLTYFGERGMSAP